MAITAYSTGIPFVASPSQDSKYFAHTDAVV